MSEQIVKTEARLFRNSSISHSTSMCVANQNDSQISESQIGIIHFFFKGRLLSVLVGCISKQSAIAEKVYIGVKWAVNLSEK